MAVPIGENMTFRMNPYVGWHIHDVIVDGVSVGPVSSYTFNAVDCDHTIRVTYKTDTPETAAPTVENLKKLIDFLVNDTPLDENYDFDRNGVIDGRDLILMQMRMRG